MPGFWALLLACASAAVSADMTTTVGATPRVETVKSAPGPATEFKATEVLEKRAARVKVRGYREESESAGRNRSDGLSLCFGGRADTSPPIAATRF